MTVTLDRPNLSTAAQDQVRELIIVGDLVAGERLNEVALAARLGVSRTPIREALSQLIAEGFVQSIPRRGFFVPDLSCEEVRQLYPMRQLLDPEALRLSGIPPASDLARLARLNEQFGRASRVVDVIELDDRWHLALIAGCPNRILVDLIRQFMRRTRRYELAYLGQDENVSVATTEHEVILDRLHHGDLAGACEGLRQNMQSATEPLLAWLAARAGGPSTQGDDES